MQGTGSRPAQIRILPGAMLLNAGRGRHVVDKDVIASLDSGQQSYAASDALGY